MKKTKFIALALIVAMALTGAGYAYWTETLTVKNTIKTGMLDFIFTDVAIKIFDENEGNAFVGESILLVNSDEKDNGDTSLSFELLNMHPGAGANIKFNVLNNGTIDGYIDEFELQSSTDEYNEYILITSLKVNNEEKLEEPISISQLPEYLENTGILGPEESISYEIDLQIDPSATEDDVPENIDAIVYTLTAIGKQYNDVQNTPVEPEPEPVKISLKEVNINVIPIIERDMFGREALKGCTFIANVEPEEAEETATYEWWITTGSINNPKLTKVGEAKIYEVTSIQDFIKIQKIKVIVTGNGDYEGTVDCEIRPSDYIKR